jgi:hypothetical protein
MAEICPPVGTTYRDRLLKLPRRLGFDATPRVLQQSREAVESDLLEFSRTATAWSKAGTNHAALLLDHLRETEETLIATADLQSAFLDDLAEHITTTAELDDESQIRLSFKRYAAGLSSYARRTRADKLAAIGDLRKRREEIEAWLASAVTSTLVDEIGFLNRIAAEMRIETEIGKGQPFCVIVVARTEDGSLQRASDTNEIVKDLGEKLAATIRPYDMVFRWSQNQLVTIFGTTGIDIAARVQQISGWLGSGTATVANNGEITHTTVSVVEYLKGESARQLIARVESESRQEAVV